MERWKEGLNHIAMCHNVHTYKDQGGEGSGSELTMRTCQVMGNGCLCFKLTSAVHRYPVHISMKCIEGYKL